MNSRLRLRPPKQTVGDGLGQADFADQRAVRGVAMDAVPGRPRCCPAVSTRKPSKSPPSQSRTPRRPTACRPRRQRRRGCGAGRSREWCGRCRRRRAALVGREGQTVGLHDVVETTVDLAARGSIGRRGRRRSLRRGVALVVAVDAVGRIGEPDRAVRLDDHVVGRVEPFAVERSASTVRLPSSSVRVTQPARCSQATSRPSRSTVWPLWLRQGCAKTRDRAARSRRSASCGRWGCPTRPDSGRGEIGRPLGPASARPELVQPGAAIDQPVEARLWDLDEIAWHRPVSVKNARDLLTPTGRSAPRRQERAPSARCMTSSLSGGKRFRPLLVGSVVGPASRCQLRQATKCERPPLGCGRPFGASVSEGSALIGLVFRAGPSGPRA